MMADEKLRTFSSELLWRQVVYWLCFLYSLLGLQAQVAFCELHGTRNSVLHVLE